MTAPHEKVIRLESLFANSARLSVNLALVHAWGKAVSEIVAPKRDYNRQLQ